MDLKDLVTSSAMSPQSTLISQSKVFSSKERTGGKGNGLFAKQTIKLSDVILTVERPLIEALDNTRLDDTCYNCLETPGIFEQTADGLEARNSALRRCTGCKVVRYCGRVSRTKSSNSCDFTSINQNHRHPLNVVLGHISASSLAIIRVLIVTFLEQFRSQSLSPISCSSSSSSSY